MGEDAYQNWDGTCGKYCNTTSSERGLRLLEFASYNSLILANTLGAHKLSRRVTWHSLNGEHHNQIDYIMVKRRFRSSINIAKTRSFPGADIRSDHELVIMTFKLHLKRVNKQFKFDLDKLKDPTIAEAFEAMIGGKFAALTTLCDDDRDTDTITNTLNTAVTDTANEILGKYHTVKKPWVTNDVLDLCDKRRELKKKSDTEGAKEYRAINQDVKKAMKKAKENWIDEQCQSIEDNLKKNNSKKAYQLVKDLTSTKKVRMSTMQNKEGKSLTEDQDILKRWTEYYSELYNYTATGDSGVLQVPTATSNDNYPILREEVEAVTSSNFLTHSLTHSLPCLSHSLCHSFSLAHFSATHFLTHSRLCIKLSHSLHCLTHSLTHSPVSLTLLHSLPHLLACLRFCHRTRSSCLTLRNATRGQTMA